MAEKRAGRAARRRGAATGVDQPPWQQLSNPLPPVDLISADEVEAIHDTALVILAEIGMKVLGAEARGILAAAGAEVDEAEAQVRFDPAMVMEKMAHAPERFTFRARNPDRSVRIGGPDLLLCSVGGPAFVADADGTRRAGSYADQCDYMRLTHALNIIHQEGGGAFEALDLPEGSRHLDLYFAELTLTDKSWTPWCLGAERSRDALEMMAIALGEDLETLTAGDPVFSCIINTNSPLQLDQPMSEGLIEMARHGQCITVTPFTLAGAMAPVTLAGAIAQQTAEALAAMVLAQCVRPGCPVIYGGFTSNVDMRTGSPVFGTPEYVQATRMSGQMARRYGVPFRSSNVTTAHKVDAQAAYESQMALWGAVTGGAHLIKHCAGWLGGGLTASKEKMILDAEMLQMIAATFSAPEVSRETLAMEAVREVGPAGHYFGAAHTMERYQTAFYTPLISYWGNYENWRESGQPDIAARAGAVADRLLEEYEAPPLETGAEDALRDYVARRKRDIHGPRAATEVGAPQP